MNMIYSGILLEGLGVLCYRCFFVVDAAQVHLLELQEPQQPRWLRSGLKLPEWFVRPVANVLQHARTVGGLIGLSLYYTASAIAGAVTVYYFISLLGSKGELQGQAPSRVQRRLALMSTHVRFFKNCHTGLQKASACCRSWWVMVVWPGARRPPCNSSRCRVISSIVLLSICSGRTVLVKLTCSSFAGEETLWHSPSFTNSACSLSRRSCPKVCTLELPIHETDQN